MLGRVGEALGHHVVDGCFDALVEAQWRNAGDLDRERGAVRERLEGRFEPAVREDGRMKTPGELAEFLERELQLLADAREHCLRSRRVLA